MSRLLGLAVLLAGGAAGCEVGHACTLIGCIDGLVVSFTGLKTGTGYEIKMAQITTTPEVVPLMTCEVAAADAGFQQLACTSGEAHSEFGTSVQIRDNTIQTVQITVSSGGAQIAQQTFDVTFTSKEINGPGCGICTSAHVDMTVP